jgi:hypothetical protein
MATIIVDAVVPVSVVKVPLKPAGLTPLIVTDAPTAKPCGAAVV